MPTDRVGDRENRQSDDSLSVGEKGPENICPQRQKTERYPSPA